MTKIHLRIIIVVAVIGLTFAACGETEKAKTVKGTVTANEDGEVEFMYSRLKSDLPAICAFTTNLNKPADKFEVKITSGNASGKTIIEGLEEGQEVHWTATVEGNPLNHGSDNFVHIIND